MNRSEAEDIVERGIMITADKNLTVNDLSDHFRAKGFLEALSQTDIEWDRLRAQNKALVKALKVIPPERLELLADWIDIKDPSPNNGVQADLRKMAKLSKEALAQNGKGTNSY